jgi:nucleotide-binding universal stress UspA family protein
MMYTKIVVPLDGSKLAEQILPHARLFAEASKAPIHLLYVNDPDAMTAYSPPLAGEQYLREISGKYALVGALESVEMGKPAEVIVDRAGAEPGALIAMATHGLSGPRRWLLGSVASKVVQTAASPVLLVRPSEDLDAAARVQLNTVFVPLDGSGLAERVLPHVAEIAQKMDLEVYLVRAYISPPQSYVMGNGTYLYNFDRVKQQIRDEVEEYLKAKTEQLQAEGLRRVSSIALDGDAAGEIVDVARKTPHNLIAISTHGRSGMRRWVLGSVTEKVVHHSGDPVLIVRAI